MNILISAPSLDANKNVSGISAVVSSIMGNNHGDNYFHLEVGRTDKDKLGLHSYYNNIKKLLLFPIFVKRNRIELFHQNLPLNNKGVIREFLFNLAARLCRVPVLVHIHGGEYLMKRPDSRIQTYFIESILSRSKVRVVLSEVEALVVKDLYGVDGEPLPNCVDTSVCKSQETKNFNRVPRILFMGRFNESKGLLEMIEAFKLLYSTYRFQFVLCGKGHLEDQIVKAFRSVMGNDFEFLGVVSGAEKQRVLDDSDYFILPSNFGEGLPIALLEAMSFGLIPIVTDDASMKSVVTHGFNGVRVLKYSPTDIKEKLQEVFHWSVESKKRLSANARKTIVDNYSTEKYFDRLLRLYQQATA